MTQTVLIVDDDRAVVERLADALTEAGFHVRMAFDGQMALDAIDRLDTDAVITDLRMPRMDGFDLVRRLRERPRPIPVLVLTALRDLDDATGPPFVAKPFDIDHVIGEIRRLLDQAQRGG